MGIVCLSGHLGLLGGGTAYVYRRTGTTWEHEATLIGDRPFGRSVALSGDIAIVGETIASAPNGTESGAVHVFRRIGASWLQEARLTPSDAASYDRFGWSLGFSGNTIVVGAAYKEAAYVFRRHGSEWIEEAKLLPPAESLAYRFGNSVSTDGSLIVVGAPGDDWDKSSSSGLAYVYQPPPQDCNQNDVPDLCDVRDGTAEDCNHDDVPDECDWRAAADFDFDGDTDLRDLASFLTCYTGANGSTLPACCEVFDGGGDQDVDVADWAAFRAAMGGPG